jgi:signal transduction histidine kinase
MKASTAHRRAHGVWLTTLLIWTVGMMLVRDRGRGPGFEVSTTGAGEGMQIMRDRIAGLAGELMIESPPGRGTTITGRVPTRVMEASSV